MSVEVVTVSSHTPAQPYYHYAEYLASLARFGVQPTVLGPGQPWRGLMTKPYLLRAWLRAGQNRAGRLIVTDAWDILFCREPSVIDQAAVAFFGNAVVFNGEKSCWPREDLRDAFPQTVSPWRYLNSGFFCGPADRVLALLEAMDIERVGFDPPGGPYPNDQGEYQRLFAAQPVEMAIDAQCILAQTLSACEPDEFDFSGPRIRNVLTGSEPMVFHANGGAKEKLLPLVLGKLRL